MKVICPYCGKEAVLIDSKEVYGKDYGNMWICKCIEGFAYVGCRKG